MSRHVIIRETFNDAKTSIWMDTMQKVLKLAFPNLYIKENRTDWFWTFPNGSEIWIAGLDDTRRVEKILGKEYSTIFFNECSQLNYSSVQIALTRLAQRTILKNKVYYDENPPTKAHWSYWLFIKKLNPETDEPLKNPDKYASLLMNPTDNLDNIAEDYLEVLEDMSPKDQDRFMRGLFGDNSDGQAYYSFDYDKHVKPCKLEPGTCFILMDFNVEPGTATLMQFRSNTFYFVDEIFQENNSDTYKMINEFKEKKWPASTVIADSTGINRKTSGKSDFQILKDAGYKMMYKTNPYVTDRVNNANRIMGQERIVIDPKCKKLINDYNKVFWKDNKLDQKGVNRLLTHISDGAGYGMWALDPIKTKSDAKIKIY